MIVVEHRTMAAVILLEMTIGGSRRDAPSGLPFRDSTMTVVARDGDPLMLPLLVAIILPHGQGPGDEVTLAMRASVLAALEVA